MSRVRPTRPATATGAARSTPHQDTTDTPSSRRALRCASALFAAVALALLAAGVVASAWTWGVHALAFLPRFVWAAAGAALSLLLMPGVAAGCFRWCVASGTWVLGGRWRALATALVASCVFAALRLRFQFLGDGVVWLEKIEHHDKFYHFEPLATALVATVAGRAADPRALAGVPSIVLGALYVWAVSALVRRLWAAPAARAVAWWLLVLHPAILIFFGYVESYPLLLVLQVAVAAALLRVNASWRSLVWATLWLAIAIASHLQALAWTPALVVAAASAGTRHGRAPAWLAGVTASVVAIAAALVLVRLVGASPRELLAQLGGASGVGGARIATLFGVARAADVANEIALVLAPALLLGVPALVAGAARAARWAPPWPAIAALLPGPAAFFLLVPPRIGGGRDWDLYLSIVLPVVLLAVEAWRRVWEAPRGGFAAAGAVVAGRALGVAAVATLAWLGVQLEAPRAARRLAVLQAPGGPFGNFARGYANETLGIYYRPIDTRAARDAYVRATQANAANARYFNNLGNAELALGNIAAARDAWRHALDLGMNDWFVLYNLGLTELQLGDPAAAQARCDELVRRWPDRWQGWGSRAQVMVEMGRPAEALADLDRAIALAPREANLVYLRGVALHDLGRKDDARAAWEAALRLHPDAALARRTLAALQDSLR